jgi:tRNA(Ile)-lysidine synthetase-like protein
VGDVSIAIPEIGRRLRLKVIDWSSQARETICRGAAIDVELLQLPLLLRSWRPGDSFRPHGRSHSLKLKQFLREGRVAVRDRKGWPVLTSAGSIVWARGLPVAAEVATGQNTRTGVLITEEAL